MNNDYIVAGDISLLNKDLDRAFDLIHALERRVDDLRYKVNELTSELKALAEKLED